MSDPREMSNGQWTHLREWLFIFQVAANVVAIIAIVWILVTTNAAVNQTALKIDCNSARSNVAQLTALRAVAVELGIPVGFTIPPVPEACR